MKGIINYKSLLQIRTVREAYLQVHAADPESPKNYTIRASSECLISTKMLWQLQPIDQNTSNAANRIASLFPTLVSFYMFLQNWGCEKNAEKGRFEYKYSVALNQQRAMQLQVDQLLESFENLEIIFQQGKSAFDTRAK